MGSWGERYLKRGGRGEESELLLLLVAPDELACIEAELGEIKCLDAYQLILSSVPEWLLVIRMQPHGMQLFATRSSPTNTDNNKITNSWSFATLIYDCISG